MLDLRVLRTYCQCFSHHFDKGFCEERSPGLVQIAWLIHNLKQALQSVIQRDKISIRSSSEMEYDPNVK